MWLEFKRKLKNLMFDSEVAEMKNKNSFGCRVFSRTHMLTSCFLGNKALTPS